MKIYLFISLLYAIRFIYECIRDTGELQIGYLLAYSLGSLFFPFVMLADLSNSQWFRSINRKIEKCIEKFMMFKVWSKK